MTPVLFYDTETTGLPDWKVPSDSEHQPHLVQLAAILADADTQREVASLDLIIKPDDWEIPDEVTEIHGITTEHAQAVGVDESLAVGLFLELWNGALRVAHNRTFDQRIIRIATKRYCDEATVERWADKDSHDCTMLLAKPIMQMPPKGRYGFKSPKLEEAYTHFTGQPLENAHSAMADTRACMAVYWALQQQAAAA